MLPFEKNFFQDPSYRFHRAVELEHVFSRTARKWVLVVVEVVLGFMIIGLATAFIEERLGAHWVSVPYDITLGIFLIALSFWIFIKMLNAYFNSYYFYLEGLLERGKTGAQTPYTTQNYAVCDIYYGIHDGDILKSFCNSVYGRAIFARLGMSREEVKKFLSERVTAIRYSGNEAGLLRAFTLADIAIFLFRNDAELSRFLFKNDIKEEEFLGSVEWEERSLKERRQDEHSWGRSALSKIPSVASDFAYGGAYVLAKYSNDLSADIQMGTVGFQFVYGSNEIRQLQTILTRTNEANAILVGEEGVGAMEIIIDFARDITNEHTHPALKNKRVLVLDTKIILATTSTKQDLEVLLLEIMNDAVSAGNVILVVQNLPYFIRGCQALGSEVMTLIDPYLAGDHIQFIATSNTNDFYEFMEPNDVYMKRFEKIVLSEPSKMPLIRTIERVAEEQERHHKVYFTFQSIVEIVNSAENYFDNAVMPDKAIDLLVEITAATVNMKEVVVTKRDVLNFVSHKTHIPLGAIDADERARLEALESHMKELVVGQEDAIVAIANAMRRSRAGVRNLNRPIGSFLFLGPTGVGKTETAKALATVFFGDKDAMLRLDMSEYQGEDGLGKLIGTNHEAGTLSIMLKSQPYGVFLLDEFEKANPKVLDIFLQLLDEGVIHNALGKKINGRNSIFIATSNAGAREIREAIQRNENFDEAKKRIIDTVITNGLMRPELMNRFDGVVLFRPLDEVDYRKIAVLMLEKLKKRVFEKNIDLVINDALINAVMKIGVDPEFGARPMARAIQDIVEQKIANKIIAGELGAGSTLEFTESDFTS